MRYLRRNPDLAFWTACALGVVIVIGWVVYMGRVVA